MKSAQIIVTLGFLTFLGLHSTAKADPPSAAILNAARAEYARVAVGDHVINISPETIMSDIDFFLRVVGALQELVDQGSKSDNLLERLRVANWHLAIVLSNLYKSRAEGKLKGKSCGELAVQAISQRHFIAARYFINQCLKCKDKSVEEVYRHFRGNVEGLKRGINSFNAGVIDHQKLLAESKAALIQIESEALPIFEIYKTLGEMTVAPGAELQRLQGQIRSAQSNLQAKRKVLGNRAAILTRLQGAHLELCRFIRQIIEEYELEASDWFQDGDQMPTLLQLAPENEDQLVPTLPQWQRLDDLGAIPRPTPVLAPRTRIAVQPPGRNTGTQMAREQVVRFL